MSLKNNLVKAKVMTSGGTIIDGLSKSKVDLCCVCTLRLNVDSLLCVQCGKWIDCRCARIKRVIPTFLRHFAFRKCDGNIGGKGNGAGIRWR